MDIRHLTGTPQRLETPPANGRSAGASSGEGAPTLRGTPGGGDDPVTLTSAAKRLNATLEQNQDVPVNQNRVDAIRTAIDSGRYSIDSRQLAGKMLAADRQLFG